MPTSTNPSKSNLVCVCFSSKIPKTNKESRHFRITIDVHFSPCCWDQLQHRCFSVLNPPSSSQTAQLQFTCPNSQQHLCTVYYTMFVVSVKMHRSHVVSGPFCTVKTPDAIGDVSESMLSLLTNTPAFQTTVMNVRGSVWCDIAHIKPAVSVRSVPWNH